MLQHAWATRIRRFCWTCPYWVSRSTLMCSRGGKIDLWQFREQAGFKQRVFCITLPRQPHPYLRTSRGERCCWLLGLGLSSCWGWKTPDFPTATAGCMLPVSFVQHSLTKETRAWVPSNEDGSVWCVQVPVRGLSQGFRRNLLERVCTLITPPASPHPTVVSHWGVESK